MTIKATVRHEKRYILYLYLVGRGETFVKPQGSFSALNQALTSNLLYMVHPPAKTK